MLPQSPCCSIPALVYKHQSAALMEQCNQQAKATSHKILISKANLDYSKVVAVLYFAHYGICNTGTDADYELKT